MDRFNNLYNEFLNFILKNFPSYEKYIHIKDNPDKQYLYDFIEFILPYMEEISSRNTDIFKFKHTNAQIIRGLKFKRIIDHVNKKTVSAKVIAYNKCDLANIVTKKFNNPDLLKIIDDHNIIVENIMLSGNVIIESSSESEEESDSEEDEEENKLKDAFEKMMKGEKVEENDSEGGEKDAPSMESMENMFEGSVIGNLAKELSSEINTEGLGDIKNPSDILTMLLNPDSEGQNKLGNIMNNIFQKLDSKFKNGELNQEQLLSEAQKIMGNANMLNPLQQMGSMAGMDMFNNSNRQSRRKNKRRKRWGFC